MPPHRWARGLRFNVWTCERCGARVIAVPAGRRPAAAPASRRPRISRASRPPTVADAGTDVQVHHSDSTAPAPTATPDQLTRVVIVGMRLKEIHRPEAAAFRPLPQARSVPAYGRVALSGRTGHARNPRLDPAVGPRDRIGEFRLLPRHLRPRGRAASMPSRLRRRQLSNSRARRPQRPCGPGRVRNFVPDAPGSPGTAPARPPGERHAGSDGRAWFPSGAPSSA